VNLSADEWSTLESVARRYTSPYCEVIRAKIILLADEGLSNDVIAARLDTRRQIISKWRKRSRLPDCPALRCNLEAGVKPGFPPSVVVQVKALACELPCARSLFLRFRRDLDHEDDVKRSNSG
jgi:hypothetical protein